MNILICGDDYRNSDIGLFCRRIESWRISRENFNCIYYLNAISGANIIPNQRAIGTVVVTNIGNNIYFPLVINKALAAYQSIYGCKTIPTELPGCIIHDVNLEYSAHIIAKTIAEKKNVR